MSALVVNLYGGPGAGKSSMCAGLFHDLKARGISTEMAREFAKEALWEGRLHLLEKPAYQIYLFAKQLKLIVDLNEKVDVIVTDSPLLLSLVYAPTNEALRALVIQESLRFDNLDLFLTRDKPYDPKGRTQSEDQARALDLQMAMAYTTATRHAPRFVSGNVEGKDWALGMILRRLDERADLAEGMAQVDLFEFFRRALDLQPPPLWVLYINENLAEELLYSAYAADKLPESLQVEYWRLLETALSCLPSWVMKGLTPYQLANLKRNMPESMAKAVDDHVYEIEFR